MKFTPKDAQALEAIVRDRLSLGRNAKFRFESGLSDRYPLRPDITVTGGKGDYIIEVAHTATWDSLSKLLLYQRLREGSSTLILAAKVIPDSIHSAAGELGIGTIQLPHGISVSRSNIKPRGNITSDKAWRVIVSLLRSGPSSIRRISLEEKVSYAWTHRTVKNLISRGIIVQKGNMVEVGEAKDLFNAVAWERPLKDMQLVVIRTSFESAHELARTLTTATEARKESIAFCAYTAASLQFGYGIRSDSAHCYVPSKDAGRILEGEYRADARDGAELILLLADRDVFSDSETVDGIKVTSQSQTLLDLAGLGYSGLDVLNHAVDKIWNR